MSERLLEHPLLVYVTFVLPMLLLVVGIAVNASVFLIMLDLAWLGVSFIILYLPIASDNGSSQ
ncbi:MAG: hypothetical protein ABIE25_07720 [Thermoplasmatota archaeon]|nr:hypothetical protein [Candidatus Thermoplasmatota archaeon]MBU1913894.1 hypothetical protein [Candidatus Thermoplasmatota archaeon]